jgi:hypothetical protein
MLTEEREVRMSLWNDVRCRLGMHDYADPQADESGAYQACAHCGQVRRTGQPPPDTQSHLPPM